MIMMTNNVTNIFKNKSQWRKVEQNKYNLVLERMDSLIAHYDQPSVLTMLAYAVQGGFPPVSGLLFSNCEALAQYAGPTLMTNVVKNEYAESLHAIYYELTKENK